MTSEIVLRAPTAEEVNQAKLPERYEEARRALADCQRLDEVKDWSDKFAALASYAKQAEDRSLLEHAQRIHLRAVNRMGELLKQVPPQQGRRTDIQLRTAAGTRSQVADAAGISKRQKDTALRVASVPRDEFEAAVEGDRPPSVSEMALRGTLSRPSAPDPIPASPRQVAEATDLLRRLAVFCDTQDPVSIACGPEVDTDAVSNYVVTIDRWLDRFVTNLPQGSAPDAAA
jgi:hypothetical protein